MENKDIELLLEKYREGTASKAEKALLENWYMERDTDAISALTAAELGEDLLLIAKGLPLKDTKVRRLNWWPRIAAVAAVLLLILSAYLFNRPGKPAALVVLQATAGQQKMLTLADGSRVWLHTGSTLSYPKIFTGRTREVELSGEAYFDIRHNSAKPFVIHTGKILTTVLGTAFDIREDKLHHTVEVTVTRGKVSVAEGEKLLGILTPDRQLTFNTVSQQASLRNIDAGTVIAWQRIGLQFNDITFEEAAHQLETKFNVKISFANNKVKNCRFTGAALNGDQLETILKTICDFNNATYQKQPDGSLLIDGPGCD